MAYELNITVQNGSEIASVKISDEAVEKLFPNATPQSIVASVGNHLGGYVREKISTVVAVALIQKFIDDHVTEVD